MNAGIENLLARTREAAKRRTAGTEADYLKLVDDAARGVKEFDPEALVAWLEENNHDVTTFERAVQSRAARLSAASAVAGRPAAERKLATAETKLAGLTRTHEAGLAKLKSAFDAAVAKAEAEHATSSAPFVGEKTAAEKALEDARVGVNFLEDSSSDELKAQVARAREQIAAANLRINQLTADVQKAERKSRDDRPGLIADAQYRGERTYGEEINKHTGEVGRSHINAAKVRVEANKERLVAEAIARVEKGIQDIRDKITNEHDVIASWRAEIERVELRMLIV